MSGTPSTRIEADSQSSIPVHLYDEDAARLAWAEYQDLCRQEKLIRVKREWAHQRFMAAFTAADA